MTEANGGTRTLMDQLGGLLSNPVVLEGLIAGISAISASRRTKRSGDGEPSPLGGILDMLPGILPLLSVFTGSGTSGNDENSAPVFADGEETAPEETENDVTMLPEPEGGGELPVFGETDGAAPGDAAEAGAFDVSYGSQASQRENLLLAIRPFLSESRRSAADAMVQVNKLSGLFKQR